MSPLGGTHICFRQIIFLVLPQKLPGDCHPSSRVSAAESKRQVWAILENSRVDFLHSIRDVAVMPWPFHVPGKQSLGDNASSK